MKALLLELKRLHGVLVQAHELAGGLMRYTEDTDERAALDRLAELFEDERAIIEPPARRYGKPKRPERNHLAEMPRPKPPSRFRRRR